MLCRRNARRSLLCFVAVYSLCRAATRQLRQKWGGRVARNRTAPFLMFLPKSMGQGGVFYSAKRYIQNHHHAEAHCKKHGADVGMLAL